MRAVVQRVSEASVSVDGEVVGAIASGLCVLISVGGEDTASDREIMVRKLVGLRIFADDEGRMNLDVREIGGALLLVSQFTLHGDVRRGRRPSFLAAMEPKAAAFEVNQVALALRAEGLLVEEGRFGADMQVRLCNDGPVTILIDTQKAF